LSSVRRSKAKGRATTSKVKAKPTLNSPRPKSAEPARKGSSVARKTAVAARPASKPTAQRSQPAPQPATVTAPQPVAQPVPAQPPLAPGVPIMPFPRPTILGLGSPWRTAGRPPGMPPRPAPVPHPAPAPQPRPAAVPVVTMRFPMSAVDKLIKEALAEDVGDGDLTTESLFPGKVKARGKLIANAVKGTKTRILDTRRTTPGLRFLEKYAVEVGGGVSLQKGLADRLIVTESHLALSEGVPNIVRQLRKAHQGKRIELTVTNMQE